MANNAGRGSSFRLDLGEPLASELTDFCSTNFRNKTQVIRQALSEYFARHAEPEPMEKIEKKRRG